jgi:photosystem II stability/assembly factor-like uncharacterized protein
MLYVMDFRHIAFLQRMRWTLVMIGMLGLFGPAWGQSGYYWHIPPNSPYTNSVKFDDIYFIDSLTGMSCNGDGDAYRTTDGGTTWTNVLSKPNTFFRSLVMTDALHAWVGNFGYYPGATLTDSTAVFFTTDGGTTWNPASIPAPKPIGICGLFRIGTQHLYGVGRIQGPASFIRSTDGGTTWTYTDMAPYCGFLVDLHFTGVDTGFVIGGTDTTLSASVPLILHTLDGGASWDTVHTGPQNPESWCWKIQFPSANIGFASIESNQGTVQCLKTTDGGSTWSVKDITTTHFNCQGIGFINDNIGWAGGYYGYNLHETTDGGDTWTHVSDGYNLNRIRPLSPTLLWASGKRLYRITTTPPTSIVPPQPVSTLSMQVQRCTSNECAIVRVHNPDPLRNYQLQLFDVVGRQMQTIPLTDPAHTKVSLEGIANTIIYFVVTDGEQWVSQLVVR